MPPTPAMSDPGKTVQIVLYRVEIVGSPTPSSEVGELHWLTKQEFNEKKFSLSPQIEEYMAPRLIVDNLLQ